MELTLTKLSEIKLYETFAQKSSDKFRVDFENMIYYG